MLVTDSLCALIDRHAESLANQSATRCLNERRAVMLNDQSRELKRFIGEPRNVQDINSRLPPMLRRAHGVLGDVDMKIYMDFDEFGDSFHKYMEQYGLMEVEKSKSICDEKKEKQLPPGSFDQVAESSESEEELPQIKAVDNLREYM